MQVPDFSLVPFWSVDLLLRELWSTNNRHSDYCHVGFSLDQQLLGSAFGTIKQDGRGFDSSYYNLPVSMYGYCRLGHLRLWSKQKVLLGSNLQSNQRTEAESSMEKLSLVKKGIPKFKTLTWLFILDRCPTRNRLISWGLQSDPTCLLCNREPESRDHLFFCCDYSFSVWGTLARNLNLLLPSNSWNDTLEALINLNGDRHLRFLITLAWQASIYELWRERNNRLHRKVYRSSSAILSSIKAVIKNMISSFRDINGDFSSTTMQLWFASV